MNALNLEIDILKFAKTNFWHGFNLFYFRNIKIWTEIGGIVGNLKYSWVWAEVNIMLALICVLYLFQFIGDMSLLHRNKYKISEFSKLFSYLLLDQGCPEFKRLPNILSQLELNWLI